MERRTKKVLRTWLVVALFGVAFLGMCAEVEDFNLFVIEKVLSILMMFGVSTLAQYWQKRGKICDIFMD